MKAFYLLLAVLGVVLPYGAFLPWLIENGVNFSAFFSAVMVNPISVFAWLDVLISAVALLAFILVDARRNAVKHYGLAILGTLTVGVSCGLPLYLFLREKSELKK